MSEGDGCDLMVGNLEGMVMSVETDSRQSPLFDVRRFIPEPYPPGSFYDVLERYGELIIRRQDFPPADPSQGGSDPWCPVAKSKLVLIQRYNGWKDRETVQRATTDMQVKACLGLGVDQHGPSQPTLVRHRQAMEEQNLHEVYMQRFTALVQMLELLETEEPVALDTVPIDGAGQVLDTFNLLAACIRKGLLRLARIRKQPAKSVASELDLSAYLSRSIKGSANIDWSRKEERLKFLQRLVDDACRLQAVMATPTEPEVPNKSEAEESADSTPDDDEPGCDDDEPGCGSVAPMPTPPVAPADSQGLTDEEPEAPSTDVDETLQGISERLEKIIKHDVEVGPNGEVQGIRQVAAADRIISATDPQMRHGRKSASVLIAGFKAQIVASVTFGWILLVKLIAANRHDGRDFPELLERIEALGLRPRAAIGDHAYGLLDNHRYVLHRNSQGNLLPIELIARNARPSNGGRFTKDEFDIDFETRTLTCPSGQRCTGRWATPHGEKGWMFEFEADVCGSCSRKASCVQPKARGGRTVFMVPDTERLIRAHLERRQEPGFLDLLAKRQVVERANAGFAQCGGKVAHRFGNKHVEFDATLSALAHNMRTLGSLLVRRPQLRRKLDQCQEEADQRLAALLLFFCLNGRPAQRASLATPATRARIAIGLAAIVAVLVRFDPRQQASGRP